MQVVKSKLTVPDFHVPPDINDWKELVKHTDLTSIHDIHSKRLGSGSDINQRQFCMLRVLFPRMYRSEDLGCKISIYGLEGVWGEAYNIVDNGSHELANYLYVVRNDIKIEQLHEGDQNWPGSFKPARALQEQTMTVGGVHDRDRITTAPGQYNLKLLRQKRSRLDLSRMATLRRPKGRKAAQLVEGGGDTETETLDRPGTPGSNIGSAQMERRSFPQAEDESAPNSALIVFLQSLSDLVKGVNVEWVANRVRFSPAFKNGRYNTHTDGALRIKGTNAVMAIVEVKKCDRFDSVVDIQLQEAAEEVGWLMARDRAQVPSFNNHGILISQDRDYIFVTFASYTQEYLDYLDPRNGKKSNNAFLTMQSYGPFSTNYSDDMKRFAQFVVAMMLVFRGPPLAGSGEEPGPS